MKKIILTTLLSTLSLFSIDINMDELSYGAGMGQIYNGFGGNINLSTEKEMRYLSIGCTEFSKGDYSKRENVCGVGIGYLRTDILPKYLPDFFSDTTKHAVGASLSIMSNSHTDNADLLFAYGYTYFTEGINNQGWTFGLSPTYQYSKSLDDKIGIIMNLGYQF
ncbi:MAG: hypothetical protein DSZ11_05565 [Sulfurovum sp.]|nr:MAG: hypothetical protein DSZ11_05565 [Sulfurovum sp.]